ncbi:MAG: hypothetical protein ABIB93_00020 [Chloroflexota bacterium]
MGAGASVRPEIERLVDEMLESEDVRKLVRPVLAYDIYPVIKIDREDCYLDGGTTLHGTIFSRIFKRASALAVAVATIGPGLEARVTECFKQGHYLSGLVLDALGNASTENLRPAVREIISKETAKQGFQTSSSVSPGGISWPLVEQYKLFNLVPADAINVRLTETAMMVPAKSISMVMGLGEDMPVWDAAQRCDMCSCGKGCMYRYQPEQKCEHPDLQGSVNSL